MKYLIYVLLFFFHSSVFAQQWVSNFFEEQSKTGKSFMQICDSLMEETSKCVGSKAPGLEFRQVDNDSTLSINSFKGKTSILNIWSTNCAGCRMQLPELSLLQQKYYDKDLRIIYISVEKKDILSKFFAENKTEGIKVIADNDKMIFPYQHNIKPLCLLIDKDGIIRDYWFKPEELEALEKRVKPFVGDKPN